MRMVLFLQTSIYLAKKNYIAWNILPSSRQCNAILCKIAVKRSKFDSSCRKSRLHGILFTQVDSVTPFCV